MLSGFFRGKKIVPKFGILISDKAVGRLEQYVAMMERSWEKKSELAEAMAGPLVRQSSVWQALEYSSQVMQNRLERVCKARDKETLTEPKVVAELEMMARAGLVSNIYVALHRLANNTEYLTSMKISTLEKLAEEAADAFYLSRIKDSFRLHLKQIYGSRTGIDWLL
jgi:hypothetical protein